MKVSDKKWKGIACLIILAGLLNVHAFCAEAAPVRTELPDAGWQAQVTFPDWKGYTDDTLALNCTCSFYGYHGQGVLYVQPSKKTTDFKLYLNGRLIDTTGMTGSDDASAYKIDISDLTRNGENTLQVSNITPAAPEGMVTVSVPYPEILEGTLEEEGFHQETFDFISDLIEADIANGFTSAQLAVIRNGRMVYENAWGKTSSYLPDGSVNEDSPAVTTDTMYDLASVTKMFSANYALQKLVTDEKVDLDAPVTDFLGQDFVDKTVLRTGDPELTLMKSWKAGLTLRDLLRHQGGFPADPHYCAPVLYTKDLPEKLWPANPYFAGNEPGEETKKATIEAICKTPLDYEPGTQTVYSDVDYMILGLVVEKVTGQDLNTWLKENFWEPLGLHHITYKPLENGFSKEDCAATELNGNSRDGLLHYDGYRTYTLQGEVHDEKAYYSMNGISGDAGLFANASDLARLASLMIFGGQGEQRFFSRNVLEQFTAPKRETNGNWGLGWWRQGDHQRDWYFGTQATPGTIGHQGWTGTLVMIDRERQLVIVYLTNKINTPVTDVKEDADMFDGNWYTAGTLGFVPQILSMGLDDEQQDVSAQLLDLAEDMAAGSRRLIPDGEDPAGDHPAAKNAKSKEQLLEQLKKKAD